MTRHSLSRQGSSCEYLAPIKPYYSKTQVISKRHEAAQAHYYGLNEIAALKCSFVCPLGASEPQNLTYTTSLLFPLAVTTIPADLSGLDYRIGYLRKGYDADVVMWDSHPLTLGVRLPCANLSWAQNLI